MANENQGENQPPSRQPSPAEMYAMFEQLAAAQGPEQQGVYFDPLNVLKRKDAVTLTDRERAPIVEQLAEERLTPLLNLSAKIDAIVEGVCAKKQFYPFQNVEASLEHACSRTESRLMQTKEGMNEVIMGELLGEQTRELSTAKIIYWALPYLAMYWNGLGSLEMIRERSQQLPMADMSRFFKGTETKWVQDGLAAIPLETVGKILDFFPFVDGIGERLTDRLARYTADSFYWNGIRAEINTFNPLVGERELNMTKTTQRFMVDICTSRPKIAENGEEKKPDKPATIYLDNKGEQVVQDKDGNPVGPYANSYSVETLDYFNNTGSENDRRWVIATTAALCIHEAKTILDGLPYDVGAGTMENSPDDSTYKQLFSRVKETAENIVVNFDAFNKGLLEQKLATTGFNLSYALAFGSFWVADWGWSYGWKKVAVDNGFVYRAADGVGAQGDPTASGDAFTASRPLFHEWSYQAIKGRVSSSNSGVMEPLDSKLAEGAISSLLSETAAVNERRAMVERLKKGEQPHIAKYFGIIGAYANELSSLDAWKEGERIRDKVGKSANPNLIRAVEEFVIFAPTPFKDIKGNNLYTPVVMPQFPINLFDQLSVSKKTTAGDLLRKTYKVVDGVRVETKPKDGGRRLTLSDIGWAEYKPYAEDARAVNNNFLAQVYAPIYGPADPKRVSAIVDNPMAGITTLIKALDISTRHCFKTLSDGTSVQRQTYEIIYGEGISFQHMVLGKFGALGRGSVKRYRDFLRTITPGEKGDVATNLYITLRNVEDLIPAKQGYEHYSDSFYLKFLADAEAMRPIVEASERMATATTKRMEQQDTTGVSKFISDNKEHLG